MQLSDQRWTQISSMQYPRYNFTPCHFCSVLYLISAIAKAVETFNAKTETFTKLLISLPSQLRATGSVAFVISGEVCLLTECKQMARWRIETECDFRLYGSNDWSCSVQQPQIVESVVFIVCREKVQRFSLETYSFLTR